jgi:hypothetical protein
MLLPNLMELFSLCNIHSTQLSISKEPLQYTNTRQRHSFCFRLFRLVLSWIHCLTFATGHSQDRRRTPPDYERPDDIVHDFAFAPFALYPALFTKGLLRGIQ